MRKFIVPVVLLFLSIASAAVGDEPRKVKIALMTASLPWSFGPYQSQMHTLSLILKDGSGHDGIEYEVYWLCHSTDIPAGVYRSYEDLRPHLGRMIPPPSDFPLDHLTFLGYTKSGQRMKSSDFNALHKRYGFDALVTLQDITSVIPNEPFVMPVLAWVPLHSNTVSASTSDYWILREYHGIAGLAPSGASSIRDAVGKPMEFNGVDTAVTETFGSVAVEFIPHTFDSQALIASADTALKLLKDFSVAEVDSKLSGFPIVDRGQEISLEPGHPRSLFGDEREDDFVVLLQGGNYDELDRKGWDTSLQAFVKFYNSLEDPSGVHLHIHSMESYLIESDSNGHMDAPAAVLPKGVNIRYMLHQYGIPRESYTIDIAKHAPEVVAALKKRASVCLHPSKVEGFGMNVMECQIVGTPVITTNYTAMGDFTKIGRSVPNRQTIQTPGGIYAMALPDVDGIADALRELYEEHVAMKEGVEDILKLRNNELDQFNDWVERTVSPSAVATKFRSLLLRTFSEYERRRSAKQSVLSGSIPTSGAYEISSGYHATIADWDAPWTLLAPDGLEITNPEALHRMAWMILFNANQDGPPPFAMALPATYEDGTSVQIMGPDGLNEDAPFLFRTVLITGTQSQMTRMKSLKQAALQNAGMDTTMRLPDGLAIIHRKRKNPSAKRGAHQSSEL